MAHQGEMHLRIWDVQHGACTMLWHRLNGADGKLAMIDSGSADDWTPSNYLRQQKVAQVDYLFITNADQDHLSDLDGLWQQNIPVRTLTRNPHPPAADLRRIKTAGGLSNDIERYLTIHETYNSPVTEPFNLHMGGITQKTFYNPYPQFQDTNNLSCVVSIEFAGFRILFSGDLEEDGWLALLQREDFRNELAGVHVLVASHHGRESGYCEAVFDYCSPWAVVMSDKAIVHDTQNMAHTYRRHVAANRPNGVFVRTTGRQRHVLTTRNDGHIHFNVAANGSFTIDTVRGMSEKSLKSQYQKWLWMLAVADMIALLLLAGVPANVSLTGLANWRLLTTVVIPVVVLLVVNVLSNKMKCVLVYWKRYGWLPGCEVFTKYGLDDPRIDMDALRRNAGPLPTNPGKQNALWYRLYKQVENQPEISEAQRNFLMYRDMAVWSLPFILLAPVILYLAGASPLAQWLSAGLFVVQYVLTAVSSRHSGIRFVTSVLALHSVRATSAGIVQVR